jgi:AraC-like DNA-binding protein
MPIYMDRHDIRGVTAEQVAAIHQHDLRIEHKYGCRALTYWFDEKRGTAFCLIEAPEKISVEAMHREAHGQVPNWIIEVENRLVEIFLGRIDDPATNLLPAPTDFPVFEDPAFRIIMALQIKNTARVIAAMGLQNALEHFKKFHAIVHESIRKHNGRKTDYFENKTIASFTSPAEAVNCAIILAGKIKEFNKHTEEEPVQTALGLAAGEPVTSSNSLFGETIQLARRLCLANDEDSESDVRINISSVVHNLYIKSESEQIRDNIELNLLNPGEETFLNRLMDLIEENCRKEAFNVAEFGRQMGMSKSQLYRKVKSLTGSPPGDFIRNIRLMEAVKLIEQQSGNIAQIAYASGFGNPSWFSRCFREYAGVTPSEYVTALTNSS